MAAGRRCWSVDARNGPGGYSGRVAPFRAPAASVGDLSGRGDLLPAPGGSPVRAETAFRGRPGEPPTPGTVASRYRRSKPAPPRGCAAVAGRAERRRVRRGRGQQSRPHLPGPPAPSEPLQRPFPTSRRVALGNAYCVCTPSRSRGSVQNGALPPDWPETATAVAARLQRWQTELLAPYDVADLVGRTVTPGGPPRRGRSARNGPRSGGGTGNRLSRASGLPRRFAGR